MAWTGGITNAGSTLLSSWVSGSSTLYILRAACGDGTQQNLPIQTAMANELRDIAIAENENMGSSGIKYKFLIQPASTAQTITQIGLFAKLGESGTETLIALFQNTDGINVPGVSDMPDFIYVTYAILAMSNTASLSVNVDTSAVVNQQEFDALEEDVQSIEGRYTNGILNALNGGTGQTSLQATRNAMGLGNTTGALPPANGGTGQTSLQAARNAMGLGNTTSALPPENGGTGQTSLQATRNAMGLGNTTGALPPANGGPGQTSLQATRNAMGLGNTTGALPPANGGTGQASLQATRNAMGLGNTTGALPVANGGTEATTASGARTKLGLNFSFEVKSYYYSVNASSSTTINTGLTTDQYIIATSFGNGTIDGQSGSAVLWNDSSLSVRANSVNGYTQQIVIINTKAKKVTGNLYALVIKIPSALVETPGIN